MRNNTFIVPTKNIDSFNASYIFAKLKENFQQLTFAPIQSYLIEVYHKDTFVTTIRFDKDSTFIDIDNDLKILNDRINYYKSKSKPVRVLEYELKNTFNLKSLRNEHTLAIQTTTGHNYKLKDDIDYFLRDMFSAYIVEHGSYPEIICPLHIRGRVNNNLN